MKNLKLKIASKDEVFWNDVVKSAEVEIGAAEKALKFNKALLEMAKEKAKKAKRLF